MKKTLLATCLTALAFAASAEVEVTGAYARASMPMAKTGGAYLVIENNTEEAVRLTGVGSDFADRTELHTSKADDAGVMKMTKVEDGVEIPAGQCLLLERGGYHVMMMGAKRTWEEGDKINVTLEFENYKTLNVEVPIRFEEEPEALEKSCITSKSEDMNMESGEMKMDMDKSDDGTKMDMDKDAEAGTDHSGH